MESKKVKVKLVVGYKQYRVIFGQASQGAFGRTDAARCVGTGDH